MEQLSFQYPIWWIVFGVALAAVMSLLMYWRARKLDDKKAWLRPTLWFLRFLPILSIALLILGPLLKRITEESKKPAIAILMDQSQSVGDWLDNNGQGQLYDQLTNGANGLSEQYDIVSYRFGQNISDALTASDTSAMDDQITDVSKALTHVYDVFEGENLGAVILATDAIYNAGQNPLYSSIPQNIPIISVALGDTSKIKDATVKTVLHNEVSYLNDEMLTQVDVAVTNAAGMTLQLTVDQETSNGWKNIARENIRVTSNDFFTTQDVTLAFDKVGIDHYRYSVSPISNELNRTNNRKDIYIDVLDARQNIGIIANAPHPDVTALKQLMEENKNYVVEVYYKDPTASEMATMDLAILHDVPSTRRPIQNILRQLETRRVPKLYIVGQQTNLGAFNRSQTVANVTGGNGSVNNAQASLEGVFSNFTISPELTNALSQYPPLATPYGTYELSGNANTLLHQSIGDIKTDYPLLSFADVDGVKTSYLFGTDIWRWKLFDYLQYQNFDRISELVDKTIIYTTTKEDKRKFRIHTSDNVYLTNEDVIFSGELYNNNYELINEPEVTIKVQSQEGTSDYTMSRSDRAYLLDIGQLPAGRYSYNAETIFNGEAYQASGKFVIREVQYELYDLQARHDILYGLSDKTGGQVVYPQDIESMITDLGNNDKIKPVIYQNTSTQPLMNNKWWFFLLILPLILEWFLRRYHGAL